MKCFLLYYVIIVIVVLFCCTCICHAQDTVTVKNQSVIKNGALTQTIKAYSVNQALSGWGVEEKTGNLTLSVTSEILPYMTSDTIGKLYPVRYRIYFPHDSLPKRIQACIDTLRVFNRILFRQNCALDSLYKP